MRTLHILVSGRVQGVCYRSFTLDTAQRLGINGNIKNKMNGSVEIIAQGDEKDLREFIEHCKKGPMNANVEGITIEEISEKEIFENFKIDY